MKDDINNIKAALTAHHTTAAEHNIAISKTHQELADCFSKAATGDAAPHCIKVAEKHRTLSSKHADMAQDSVDLCQTLAEKEADADKLARASGTDGNPWTHDTEKAAAVLNPWQRDLKVSLDGIHAVMPTPVPRYGSAPIATEPIDESTSVIDRYAR